MAIAKDPAAILSRLVRARRLASYTARALLIVLVVLFAIAAKYHSVTALLPTCLLLCFLVALVQITECVPYRSERAALLAALPEPSERRILRVPARRRGRLRDRRPASGVAGGGDRRRG